MASGSAIESQQKKSAFDGNGWYQYAQKIPSPNYNIRPDRSDISLIVIHSICLPPLAGAQQYGSNLYVEQFFCNKLESSTHPYFAEIKNLEVSAHFYIKRNGDLIQFVATEHRAWHAGISVFEGRENCNDFSIGIELEGMDTDSFTNEQYQSLVTLSQHLIATYPKLNKKKITGHSDIAPGRKTDPGTGFDWPRFLEQL